MVPDAMALSTMNWNNDAPFDSEPVTMRYSANLATVIGHVPSLADDVCTSTGSSGSPGFGPRAWSLVEHQVRGA
jgi:hypothetical protein